MSSMELDFFKGSKNPLNMAKSIKFDLTFWRNNPDFFEPCGIWLYCGCQGSGKTLSMVQTAQKLARAYPKSVICSNLIIQGIDNKVIPFKSYEQLLNETNGIYGIIFVIDEMQIIWNSLESKNIPISEIGVFSQNRKDRRVILGTSQVYSRVAKPIREQLKYCILCNSYFKYIQYNQVIDCNAEGYSGEDDGQLDGKLVDTDIWIHKPENYTAYDTYNKIQRIERKKSLRSMK